MRVTFKVLDSLTAAPRHAANPDPQGPARMPPASRGPPPLGDPDRTLLSSGLPGGSDPRAMAGVLLRNYGFTDLPPSLPLLSDPVTRI